MSADLPGGGTPGTSHPNGPSLSKQQGDSLDFHFRSAQFRNTYDSNGTGAPVVRRRCGGAGIKTDGGGTGCVTTSEGARGGVDGWRALGGGRAIQGSVRTRQNACLVTCGPPPAVVIGAPGCWWPSPCHDEEIERALARVREQRDDETTVIGS